MTTDMAVGPWTVSNEDYHADTYYVSHSALEVFRESATLYHGRYVTGAIPRRPSTPPLVLGSALDCSIFEPELFAKRFVRGKPDMRTKAGKNLYATLVLSNPGLEFLTEEQCLRLDGMVEAVRSTRMLTKFLTAIGGPQRSMRWSDTSTAIACKCRFDHLLNNGLGLDLKTAIDPSPEAFARATINNGYHRQAAFYREGRRHVMGVDMDCPFLHVVVGSEPPHDVAVYELGSDDWQLGQRQNLSDLANLLRCRQTGIWNHHWQRGIVKLHLPPWAFRETF